jgi:hypothetical protein
MAEDMDSIMLRLKSMPNENGTSREFEISYGAAKLSELIKDSVGEDFEEDDAMPEIDVPRVKGDCLEKVVDFMKHYNVEPMKEIPTPLGGSSFNEVCEIFRQRCRVPMLSILKTFSNAYLFTLKL